jgi:hypothetical protein
MSCRIEIYKLKKMLEKYCPLVLPLLDISSGRKPIT